MMNEEKRHHQRIDSLNLIAYTCLDETGEVAMQGMGRTLNVSEGGILLETYAEIDSRSDILLNIGLEDDLVEIKGTVVSSRPAKEGAYEAGIQFHDIGDRERTILKLYIQAFKGL